MKNRREFIVQFSLASGVLTVGNGLAHAQDSMVAEADAQAKSLGYASLATKVDKAKFPKYAAGQQCNSCSLFVGKATDPAGGCPLFAGKKVSGKGWCSAWAKKA
jgi:High potential iron-sulfur protein